uniref:Alba domain-containing protein n=1 Tax=Syphacia muris TaxID=451379 RepID=A0A0N5B074_9BILA
MWQPFHAPLKTRKNVSRASAYARTFRNRAKKCKSASERLEVFRTAKHSLSVGDVTIVSYGLAKTAASCGISILLEFVKECETVEKRERRRISQMTIVPRAFTYAQILGNCAKKCKSAPKRLEVLWTAKHDPCDGRFTRDFIYVKVWKMCKYVPKYVKVCINLRKRFRWPCMSHVPFFQMTENRSYNNSKCVKICENALKLGKVGRFGSVIGCSEVKSMENTNYLKRGIRKGLGGGRKPTRRLDT